MSILQTEIIFGKTENIGGFQSVLKLTGKGKLRKLYFLKGCVSVTILGGEVVLIYRICRSSGLLEQH